MSTVMIPVRMIIDIDTPKGNKKSPVRSDRTKNSPGTPGTALLYHLPHTENMLHNVTLCWQGGVSYSFSGFSGFSDGPGFPHSRLIVFRVLRIPAFPVSRFS